MEMEKPFKLFPLPRLNSSHVSAVKPQSMVENACFFQDFKSPFGMGSAQDVIKNKNSDCFSKKVTHLPVIEEENTESVNQLYSKLYKEAEKIKKWKFTIETEVKQNEKKLQENKKTVDAQRKAIKELQFENEKLSLKLEDEINENKDLTNQSNATRHVCDLLKDTCTRAAEKANMYDNDREETRQMYGELNNNIERMIMAFEELRVQAENSRQEMYIQIKQEAEKRQQLENEYKLEMNRSEQQILELMQVKDNRNNKLSDLKLQLHESTNMISALEEASKNRRDELEKSQCKAQQLLEELEESKVSLQKTKESQNSIEIELQSAQVSLLQTTKEKQTKMEELEEIKALHALQLAGLQVTIDSLNEILTAQQKSLKESEGCVITISLESQRKTTELEEMTNLKDSIKTELEELKIELASSIRVQKDLEQQVVKAISESQLLSQKLEETDGNREALKKEIGFLKTQVNSSFVDGESCSRKIAELKSEIDKKELKYEELLMDYDRLLAEKEKTTKSIDISAKDIKNIQKDLKASKESEDRAKKEIENLEDKNHQLRKEVECLMEQLKLKGEEVRNQLDECEHKTRNIEGEISKREKQLKTLENKLSSLKKQVENKNKSIEELQQENKCLKKKITGESKQCSLLEAEVEQLHIRLEDARMQYEQTVSNKQKEIEDIQLREQSLHEEVERLKLTAEVALKSQQETDIRCQHKIAEMVALMEKHKHQYDKMVEEKDTELDLFRSREQEITSTKAFLETDLCNKKDEIVSLQKQLKQQTEEKEEIAKKAEESKMSLIKEMKHKKVQTSFMETPKQITQKIDLQTQTSSSKKPLMPHFASHLEIGRQSDNTERSPWTSSRSTIYTPQKVYSLHNF
ncbi:hypothetical protein FKM82_016772 [Ascaphus truei]